MKLEKWRGLDVVSALLEWKSFEFVIEGKRVGPAHSGLAHLGCELKRVGSV